MKNKKKFSLDTFEPADLSHKTSETFHSLHTPHKSLTSDYYSEWEGLIFMQNSSEIIKLKYKLDKALKENHELSQKISKITEKYSSEIKKRDEVIISLTNLIKEREEKFKKLLSDQSEETKNQVFIKENEIFHLKNSLKRLKHKQTKKNSTIDLKIEIESLRKLLEFAEKENKDLKTENNSFLSKEKITEIDLWADVCFEFSVMLSRLNKVKEITFFLMNPKEPIEKILIKADTVHFEVTKNDFKDWVLSTKTTVDIIQTNVLDLYANYCGNKCDVQ